MPTLDKIDVIDRPQKAIIYGPPKSGKSLLVGKLAEAGFELVWLDGENGSVVLANFIAQECKKNIQLISIPDTQDTPRFAETVANIFGQIHKPVKIKICVSHGKLNCVNCTKSGEEFDTIDLESLKKDRKKILVIDSLTQLHTSVCNYIGMKGNPMQAGNLLSGYDKFEWDDWGQLGVVMGGILNAIQSAPMHIAVISHEAEVALVDKSNKIVPAGGTRNFARNNAKFFDHVVYCYQQNGKHSASSSTTYSSAIMAGSRSGLDLKQGFSLADIFRGKCDSIKQSTEVEIKTEEKGKTEEAIDGAQRLANLLSGGN